MIKLASYLACAISLVLTVILLSSFATGYMMLVYASLGIVIEIAKISSFQMMLQKQFKMISSLVFSIMLVVSLGASVASLNKSVSETFSSLNQYEKQLSALTSERDNIAADIQRYRELDRIKVSKPLQKELAQVNNRIIALERPVTLSGGLIESVSTLANVTPKQAATGVYTASAVVIDIAALFLMFVVAVNAPKIVIPEPKNVSVTRTQTETQTETVVKERKLQTTVVIENVDHLVSAFKSGTKPSIRNVMKLEHVGYDRAALIIQNMIDNEILVRTGKTKLELVEQQLI